MEANELGEPKGSGIRTIIIPWSAGKGNFFCKIRGLDKSLGAIYWQIMKHDGHLLLVLFFMVFGGLAALALTAYFETPLVLLAFAPALAIVFRVVRHYLKDDVRRLVANQTFNLYLRPFSSDRKLAVDLGAGFRYKDVPLTGGMGRNVRAIGSPHDAFPRNLGLNVSLTHAPDRTWQAIATELITQADHIWVHCGPQEWVQWEIRKIFELRRMARIGFILPPVRKEEIWALVLSNAPKGLREIERLKDLNVARIMFICFASEGSTILVESQRNSADDYLPGLYAARYAMLDNQ